MSTYLEKLETLHPDILNTFLDTGKSDAISPELQQFIIQLQWATEINQHTRSITRAAQTLKQRVWATQRIRLSIPVAKSRIYAAKEYFHVDNNVAQSVWDLDTADKFEDLARLSIAQDKLDMAGRYYEKANELRRRANAEAQNQDQKAPVFLISNTLSHEEMGFEKENLKKIAGKDSNGFYLELINSFKGKVEKEDLARLKNDAGVIDTEYEEVSNE